MRVSKKSLFLIFFLAFCLGALLLGLARSRSRIAARELLIQLDGSSFMVASAEHGSLTAGNLDGVPLRDETGKDISVQELAPGDYLLVDSKNCVLYSYPAQFTQIYCVRKTGERDPERAKELYDAYLAGW